MIFVTVGTAHFQFERLVRAVASLPLDDVVIQHGPVHPPDGVARAVPFMPMPETVEHFRRADVVVTHGGVGSLLCALRVGHTPVVVPRLKRWRETVDDHQADLARALGDEGRVIPVWDTEDLAGAVRSVPPRRPPAENRARGIHRAVSAAILG